MQIKITQLMLICLIHFGIITIQRHLNQYYDSLERLSPYKDGGLEAEMRAVTIKAFEKFWSVAQMPMDEDNKNIVARSFVYIEQILTKRESLVRSGEQTF